MDELIQFLTNNWIPVLLMITCLIHDRWSAMVIGFGFMLFGTNNQIFLWVAFIISILNVGTTTYTKSIKKKTIKTDTSEWEM